MPGLPQRNGLLSNGSSAMYSLSTNGFWSKHPDDVSYNQLQKFWTELSPQARRELLRINKQTLFEQACRNMYCSRCNGLLLEVFLQLVMYGKSLHQEGAGANSHSSGAGNLKNRRDGCSSNMKNLENEMLDPSGHPWGGLTTARDGSLTIRDCYLLSKSLKGLQAVFDSARTRERERELLYPDACGGGSCGWLTQGTASYGRGHGTRETCALHTTRLSCDTLVDFWSALGEETRQSLLRMKEEDFIERLMQRFDKKRFCRDCRRNVIREFKELKELKRIRREPHCTRWFCVADTAFQYEVSENSIKADWHQTFADTLRSYHHFEWAVGTSEGKSDILEFENVGMNGTVHVKGLDLGSLGACFITLRAWKLDGRCTEFSVKAHPFKGQQCVHCRLVVEDGHVTITKGESIRRFFEYAEEAEEEEDDDSVDKDGNELDGECSRPQKHAKSPELAQEFLLDAATVIFKEQVEKAFREGTARQNAHSIFVCLALKLLEERVHVACKEIITLEKQTKLLEEVEKEKREEEERKEKRRTKGREKKLRRKERQKEKEKDKENKYNESNETPCSPEDSKEELSLIVNEEQSNPISGTNDSKLLRPESLNNQEEETSNERSSLRTEDSCNGYDGKIMKDENGTFTVEQSKFSRRRLKFQGEVQVDIPSKGSEKRQHAVVSEGSVTVQRSDPRHLGESFVSSSRGINGSNRQRQLRMTAPRSNDQNYVPKFNEKFHGTINRTTDGFDRHSCSSARKNEYRVKMEPLSPQPRGGRETKPVNKFESALDASNRSDVVPQNNSSGGIPHLKKVWEPLESQKCPRSNSDSDFTLRSASFKVDGVESVNNQMKSNVSEHFGVSQGLGDNYHGNGNSRETNGLKAESRNGFQMVSEVTLNSAEASDAGLHSTRNISLGKNSNSILTGTFSSDNCSSCLSEGEFYTTANHGNMASSSTSDSDDSSQHSEGRESSSCMQKSFSECHLVGMAKGPNTNGREALQSKFLLLPLSEGAGSSVSASYATKLTQNLESGLANDSMCSQHQSLLPPVPNQSVRHQVFHAPPTLAYYHQNPVSWPAAPTDGLMPLPHPHHYVYACPLGYGLNGNSHYCVQFNAMQPLATSLSNPPMLPVYHPVAKPKGLNVEEQTQVSKPAATQQHPNGFITKRTVLDESKSKSSVLNGENRHDHSVESYTNNDCFSLFHFGGPVALSKACKSNPALSTGKGFDLSSKHSAECLENGHACNKKEMTAMEEYNLFAANNCISFSIF